MSDGCEACEGGGATGTRVLPEQRGQRMGRKERAGGVAGGPLPSGRRGKQLELRVRGKKGGGKQEQHARATEAGCGKKEVKGFGGLRAAPRGAAEGDARQRRGGARARRAGLVSDEAAPP